jgi:hypothetical protein
VSRIYECVPPPVIEACEQVLRAYVADEAPTCDPRLLQHPAAPLFAEAAALQAVELLVADRGTTADLLFLPLTATGVFAELVPAMPPLLRFLRGRLAGHAPVLRLDPDTRSLPLTLLLLAGQALAAAQEAEPEALRRCLDGLAGDPADDRTPAGDLAIGLSEDDAAGVDNERYFRDQLRRALTGAAPVRRALTGPDDTILIVADLAARPDVADLIRMLATDPPPGGADTVTTWSAFAGTQTSLIRLDVAWFEPVRTELALVLDVDEYGPELDVIARSPALELTGLDPREHPDELVSRIRIPVVPADVRRLLNEATARRDKP